jgi:hypothetical protein
MLQQYLAIMPQAYPGFPIEDYRRGAARDHWDTLSACRGPAVADRSGVLDSLGPNDLGPTTPAAADALRGYLRKATLPQAPAAAPMLITPGTPDGLVPPEQTAAAVERACAMGDVIDYVQPDAADALGWITDRFNGVPAPNTCPGATPTSSTPTTTASSSSDESDTQSSDTEEVTSTAQQPSADSEQPASHHEQPAPPPPADVGDGE